MLLKYSCDDERTEGANYGVHCRFNLDAVNAWKKKDNIQIALSMKAFKNHKNSILEKFPFKEHQFIDRETVSISDVPLWDEEALDFIQMTKERKLILR